LVYLFDSVHQVGVLLVLLALAWGGAILRLQRRHLAGNVLIERRGSRGPS
jgi:hypothetical protein